MPLAAQLSLVRPGCIFLSSDLIRSLNNPRSSTDSAAMILKTRADVTSRAPRKEEGVWNAPVVVAYDEEDVFAKLSQIFLAYVHLSCVVWNLEHESLPVINLVEHLQQEPVRHTYVTHGTTGAGRKGGLLTCQSWRRSCLASLDFVASEVAPGIWLAPKQSKVMIKQFRFHDFFNFSLICSIIN